MILTLLTGTYKHGWVYIIFYPSDDDRSELLAERYPKQNEWFYNALILMCPGSNIMPGSQSRTWRTKTGKKSLMAIWPTRLYLITMIQGLCWLNKLGTGSDVPVWSQQEIWGPIWWSYRTHFEPLPNMVKHTPTYIKLTPSVQACLVKCGTTQETSFW